MVGLYSMLKKRCHLLNKASGNLNLLGRPAHSILSDSVLSGAEFLISRSRKSNASGIEFTEIMSGHISMSENISDNRREGFEAAAKIARGHCEMARFFLTVKAPDMKMRAFF